MTTWIFLRGLTRESRHWGEFVDIFRAESRGAEVVALDLPGNGSMNQLPSFTRVQDMVAWCRQELSARGMRPPYCLLGMSLGAMVAAKWACAHAEEVRACVLINTSLRPYSPFYQRLRPANYPALLKLALLGGSDVEWETTILRITSRRERDVAGVLASWIAWRRERPVARANALRQLLAAWRYRAPVERPLPPMLVLASAQDPLVNPQCSREIAKCWQAAYAEHPAAGHDLPLDDGAWVAQQVRAWLGSIEA
ncbi:MAG: alpha/beta hydrolase [Proteobacteria bacterium]|nr:alpha/beta hydrolase [Pseudomonadota bacterium]